jgi:hypothetical protein
VTPLGTHLIALSDRDLLRLYDLTRKTAGYGDLARKMERKLQRVIQAQRGWKHSARDRAADLDEEWRDADPLPRSGARRQPGPVSPDLSPSKENYGLEDDAILRPLIQPRRGADSAVND